MNQVIINRKWCKGCGICVAFCAKKALTMDAREKAVLEHPELCVLCGLCEKRCPDLAITIGEAAESGKD